MSKERGWGSKIGGVIGNVLHALCIVAGIVLNSMDLPDNMVNLFTFALYVHIASSAISIPLLIIALLGNSLLNDQEYQEGLDGGFSPATFILFAMTQAMRVVLMILLGMAGWHGCGLVLFVSLIFGTYTNCKLYLRYVRLQNSKVS